MPSGSSTTPVWTGASRGGKSSRRRGPRLRDHRDRSLYPPVRSVRDERNKDRSQRMVSRWFKSVFTVPNPSSRVNWNGADCCVPRLHPALELGGGEVTAPSPPRCARCGHRSDYHNESMLDSPCWQDFGLTIPQECPCRAFVAPAEQERKP